MSSYRPSNGKMAANDVETVDLTFSSPEPEPQAKQAKQPQPQQQHDRYSRQQQITSYAKKEHGRTPITKNGSAPSSSRQRMTSSNSSSLPAVSADHLRHIITTSPPQKVTDLLLDLCKSSPALSGAVARGLAPHSIWAQNTIKDYQRRTGVPQVKSEVRTPHSSSAATPGPSTEHRSYNSPRTTHPKPAVKSEIEDLEADTDDSLSDLDTFLPSHLSKGKAVAGPSSSFGHATTNQTPTSASRTSEPVLPVRIKPEPKAIGLQCMQCEKLIEPGTHCFYHIGQRKTYAASNGRKFPMWTCCKAPIMAVGCCKGNHIPLREPKITGYTESKKPRLV